MARQHFASPFLSPLQQLLEQLLHFVQHLLSLCLFFFLSFLPQQQQQHRVFIHLLKHPSFGSGFFFIAASFFLLQQQNNFLKNGSFVGDVVDSDFLQQDEALQQFNFEHSCDSPLVNLLQHCGVLQHMQHLFVLDSSVFFFIGCVALVNGVTCGDLKTAIKIFML